MPFPINQEALFAAGYSYARWERCPVCTLDVEVWNSPGKREIAMEPMPSFKTPAIRHWEQCNLAPKQEEINGRGNLQDAAGRNSNRGDGLHTAGQNLQEQTVVGAGCVPTGRCDDGSPPIKLYGVTDKNMIAVGWLDGTLKIQFRHGAYLYANVAEDTFVKIRNNPFPNALFTKLVKNHPELHPCTKVQ
jgi:hypothetical protein